MNAALVPLLLGMVGRAVQQGTLVEIVETFTALVRLIEPLIATKPDGVANR